MTVMVMLLPVSSILASTPCRCQLPERGGGAFSQAVVTSWTWVQVQYTFKIPRTMVPSELLSRYDTLSESGKHEWLHLLGDTTPEIALAVAVNRSAHGCSVARRWIERAGRKASLRVLDRLQSASGWELAEAEWLRVRAAGL